MLYYYKKIEQGKDAGRWMKVTVEENNGRCKVIDVEIADNFYYNTSLDTAYIHYLHKQAGTTPPPF